MEASWQTMFLAISILSSSCFLQAQVQDSPISITLIPPDAIQGQSIALKPNRIPARLSLCSWYRGLTLTNLIITYYLGAPDESLTGDAYTGRETVNPDCSLLIRDLSPSDSGNYTLMYRGFAIHQLGTTSFKVLEIEGPQTEQSSWVILGPVLALTVLGALLGISFCIYHQINKRSSAVQPEAPIYYNIATSGKKNARSSSNQTNLYEGLQFGDQAIYEQLKK